MTHLRRVTGGCTVADSVPGRLTGDKSLCPPGGRVAREGAVVPLISEAGETPPGCLWDSRLSVTIATFSSLAVACGAGVGRSGWARRRVPVARGGSGA